MPDYVEQNRDVKFRSRLNELPLDLKVDIASVVHQDGWNNIKRREEMMIALKDYNIDFADIGTGTNRHIIKYDGYVIKMALDEEGVNDNKQEWNVGYQLPQLNPPLADVALPHEISKGGHLLVASYAPAFTAYRDLLFYKDTIGKILNKWQAAGYLLGDVGLQPKNYANWGLLNGRPVCIDYAYIFKAPSSIFHCNKCGCHELKLDNSFSNYECPKCKNTFPDAFLRAQIDDEYRAKMFNNYISDDIAIEMEDESTVVNCKVKVPIKYNPDAPNRTESFWNALQLYNSNNNNGGTF